MCGSRKYPYLPHGRLLEIPGGGGSRGANSQRVWGVRRLICFQRVQEHCLRQTYQYRIYDLINHQIDELQYILVYSNAICIFERTFWDNNLFLRSIPEHVLRTHFQVLLLFRENGFLSKTDKFRDNWIKTTSISFKTVHFLFYPLF